MKLVQRTSNTLTMRYVPWGTWLALSYLTLKFLALLSLFALKGSPNRDDPRIAILSLILLVTLGGLLTGAIALEGKIRTLRLNKITGKLRFEQRTLWGTKLVEYPLKKVADVIVMDRVLLQPHRVIILLSQGKQDFSNMSLLSKLMLIRGSLLFLHPMFGLSLRWFECKRCAKEIRDFLDLPSKSQQNS